MLSKSSYLLAEEVTDIETAKEIFELGFKSIAKNDLSIPLFKDVSEEYLWSFLKGIIKGDITNYFIISFKSESSELVGATLLSKGSPWYNPKLKVINEEVTVSFKKGYGIARAVATYLESQLGDTADVVMSSSANEHCAKLIENTYMNKFKGFKMYKTYYKVLMNSGN